MTTYVNTISIGISTGFKEFGFQFILVISINHAPYNLLTIFRLSANSECVDQFKHIQKTIFITRHMYQIVHYSFIYVGAIIYCELIVYCQVEPPVLDKVLHYIFSAFWQITFRRYGYLKCCMSYGCVLNGSVYKSYNTVMQVWGYRFENTIPCNFLQTENIVCCWCLFVIQAKAFLKNNEMSTYEAK